MRTSLTIPRFALCAATLVAGCSSTVPDAMAPQVEAGIQAGFLAITANVDGLSLFNQTERPLFYKAIEQTTSTLVDWVPCTTAGPSCDRIIQGERRLTLWSSVLGYEPAKRAYIVYWWNTETRPDGSTGIANLQSVIVTR